ncbi:MAG: hypothetical protein AAGB31_04050 [Bdellovibrio sp.]
MRKHVLLFLVLTVVVVFTLDSHASKTDSLRGESLFPELRQPANGVSVKKVFSRDGTQRAMDIARHSADRLDQQATIILELSGMGWLEKWHRRANIQEMRAQYSREMMTHLHAMTNLFQKRRQLRGFKKLQEFEFQNMVRKSDYLLSLVSTQKSLESISDDKTAQRLQSILEQYNNERQKFDQHLIVLAEK